LPSVNALLRQALANVHTYLEMTDPEASLHRWPALYLPLTILLGKEMTKCLRKTGELQHDYTYVGQAYVGDGKRTNDHVVPMNCVIRRLSKCAEEWPRGQEGIACLRRFLREHLVMADIPNMLDRKLVRDSMPNDNWWQPVGVIFSDQEKQTALWGRYVSAGLGLVMPWNGDENFVRV
jgi:hypothetical protein